MLHLGIKTHWQLTLCESSLSLAQVQSSTSLWVWSHSEGSLLTTTFSERAAANPTLFPEAVASLIISIGQVYSTQHVSPSIEQASDAIKELCLYTCIGTFSHDTQTDIKNEVSSSVPAGFLCVLCPKCVTSTRGSFDLVLIKRPRLMASIILGASEIS